MPHKNQNGFTLVELAIALMVIGLLIGGVLKGQELIENARVTSVIRQINAYDAAILIFRNTYNALPGDIRTPTRIPTCDYDPCNRAGSGDGILLGTFERGNFYPHMARAGLVTGPMGVATPPGINENFYPTTAHGELLTVNSSLFSAPYVAQQSNFFIMGDASYVTKAKRSSSIDTKMDDGKATTGRVISIEYTGSNVCFSSTTYEYLPANAASNCFTYILFNY